MANCRGEFCGMRREGWDKRLDRKPAPCERCGKVEKVLFNLFAQRSFSALSEKRQAALKKKAGKDAWMLCSECRKKLTAKKD